MVVRRVSDLGELSDAERKMLDELDTGEVIDIGETVPEQGDEKRRVRAVLIRLLLLGDDPDPKYRLHEKGLRIRGAWIPDRLDLEGCRELRDLALIDCRFEESPVLLSAELSNLFLSGSRLPGLSADRLHAGGNVFLDGVEASGEVRLLGAKLGGSLDCNGATFRAEKDAEGKPGKSFSDDRLEAGGDVFLRGVEAIGEVRLLGAKLGGNLECDGAMFQTNISSCTGGKALNLGGSRVGGRLFLRNNARFEGVLDLSAAKFGGINDRPASWPGKGNLILDRCQYGAFSGHAPVDAMARLDWLLRQDPARWGSEFWPQPYEQLAKVLREMGHGADARTVLVEKECLQRAARRETWQARLEGARLRLRVERDGIAVVEPEIDASLDRFQPSDPRRECILEELRKSPEVHRRLDGRDVDPESVAGGADATDRVDRVSAARAPIWDYWWRLNLLRVWDVLVGVTIGYGRRPERAAMWAVGIFLLGWFFFALAGGHGAIKPNTPVVLRSDEWVSYADAVGQTQVQCFLEQPRAASYPRFNAFIYSADTLLPIVDLEMQGFWIPDDRTWGGMWARGYLWVHIAVGWALSLLAVAGFSGLVKSD
ncbi:MAG TPA: hypothetical protein PKA33_14570 [Amaricoccus sp.]|uniref:hypothetical protein n=1 Tax=Amaricoccus sp. TaxID=1872485 RepID=UPI002C8F2F2B|nr:hypothetical protein [Amaricoccus sp.]HMQ94924.1 hypothetical protein [Amaricoccus sp.]HMR53537.1 hypothetical protein [Amaricoccus sp.]HMR61245.1 hypothetical protein [Amaricoccus sp.]HMU00574.1 hypothetical protein [Amaricoccus sp.]